MTDTEEAEPESSASEEFEYLIRKIHEASTEPLHPIGQNILLPEEKKALNSFINSTEVQSAISDGMKDGERRRWGIVLSVEDDGDGTNGAKVVKYLNEHGTKPLFVYQPKAYPEAPNGFKVGDAILMTYTQPGWTPDTVKPISLVKEDYDHVAKKILAAYGYDITSKND